MSCKESFKGFLIFFFKKIKRKGKCLGFFLFFFIHAKEYDVYADLTKLFKELDHYFVFLLFLQRVYGMLSVWYFCPAYGVLMGL